jgi:large subunit ribosomal protein L3
MATIRKMIMGRKVGMTQIFAADGKAIPVTVLEVGPCYVVQRRTAVRDGYEAVQIGYLPYEERDQKRVQEIRRVHEQRRKTGERGAVKETAKRRLSLAEYGHCQAHNVPALRHLKEFRVAAPDDFPEGMEIRADVFAAGEKVDVSGTSKGRGFAGVMKRYNFRGGGASHGSMHHRKPASGGATDAARVFKNSRRPGHMGAEKVTVKGLTVVRADVEKNMLVLKGAVPGPVGGLVVITMPEKPTVERGKGKLVTFTALESFTW